MYGFCQYMLFTHARDIIHSSQSLRNGGHYAKKSIIIMHVFFFPHYPHICSALFTQDPEPIGSYNDLTLAGLCGHYRYIAQISAPHLIPTCMLL